MNRQAKTLAMTGTSYLDPHGLGKNLSTARDLALLGRLTLEDKTLAGYVQTRRHKCEMTGEDGERRPVVWDNTNRLLGIEGYDGVKTGTTTPAGACLVAAGHRGDDKLMVVVLGT